jgi:hypothetical protein
MSFHATKKDNIISTQATRAVVELMAKEPKNTLKIEISNIIILIIIRGPDIYSRFK